MLTYERLVELERSLRAMKVLSVYVDGNVTDPAGRARWRHTLDRELARVRAGLGGATHAEREAFDHCAAQLDELLPPTVVALYPPGWVAFIGAKGVHYVGSLHVPAPTLVAWGEGIRAAPYIRALKQHQAAIVTVVDSSRARVYRYLHGSLERVDTLHSHTRLDRPDHMGDPPRGGFHTGTRGRTGTDEADRARRTGRAAMMRELATLLVEFAGADGWILLGGTPEAVREAISALPEGLPPGRVHALAELDANATEARVAAASERGATLQRRAYDSALVEELVDRAAAGGKGAAGPDAVLEALRARAVQRLFFTERFLRERPAEAEEAVRVAFDQNALVEQVSGEAADTLDAHAAGIGARLRFAVGRVAPDLASKRSSPVPT